MQPAGAEDSAVRVCVPLDWQAAQAEYVYVQVEGLGVGGGTVDEPPGMFSGWNVPEARSLSGPEKITPPVFLLVTTTVPDVTLNRTSRSMARRAALSSERGFVPTWYRSKSGARTVRSVLRTDSRLPAVRRFSSGSSLSKVEPESSPDAAATAASVSGLMLAVPACGATECIRASAEPSVHSALRMSGGVSPLTSNEKAPSPSVAVVFSFAGVEESFTETVPLTDTCVEATPESAELVVPESDPPPPQPLSTTLRATALDSAARTALVMTFTSAPDSLLVAGRGVRGSSWTCGERNLRPAPGALRR